MSKPVLVAWIAEPKVYEQALADAGLADKVEFHGYAIEEQIPADVAARTDALLGWRPAKIMSSMPRLRWIQTMTAGVDMWLASPDVSKDVTLTCARGTHRLSMPENILGAIFHVTKPYMQAALDQRNSEWKKRMGVPLVGKTLGILGMGAIGQEVARKAKAMEMRIIGTKRTPEPLPNVDKLYGPEGADEVLAQSDFVVLLLPSTPDTENFINTERLGRMKKSAWLFNFARGAVIVDADLIAAVKAKTIAGAVLDVFRKEPLPSEHPFWQTEGILVLPHIGGGHPQRGLAVAELYVENAKRFVAGQPLTALVDRARGY